MLTKSLPQPDSSSKREKLSDAGPRPMGPRSRLAGPSHGSGSECRPLAAIVAKLLDDAREMLESDRQTAQTLSRARLGAAARRGSPYRSERPAHAGAARRGGLAPWQIRRVMHEIDANLASPIRMKDLSEVVRLSESYFSRAFKATLNVSPHAYILRRRIERAQEIMLTTDEQLSEIALACGLCDQAHLSRLFRRIAGASPGSWRRQRLQVRRPARRLGPAGRAVPRGMGRARGLAIGRRDRLTAACRRAAG